MYEDMAELDYAGPSSSTLDRHDNTNSRATADHAMDTSLSSTNNQHSHHHHHHHKTRKPSSGGFLIEPRRRSVYNGSPFISVAENADDKPSSKHKRVSRDFSGSSDVSRKHRQTQSVSQRSVSGQLQTSLSGGTAKGKDRPMSLRLEDERLKELLAKATETDTAWIVGMANSVGRSKSNAKKNQSPARGDIPEFTKASPPGSPRFSNSIPDLKPSKRRTSTKPPDEITNIRDNYTLSSKRAPSPPPEWAFNHRPRVQGTYENDEVDPILPNRTQDLRDGRNSIPDSRFSSKRNSVDTSNPDSRFSSKKNSLEIRKDSFSRNASSSPEPKFKNQAPKNSFGSGVLESVADVASASDDDAPRSRRLRVRRTHSIDHETDSLTKKPSTATRGVNKLRSKAAKVRTGVSGMIKGHKNHEEDHDHEPEHDMFSTESSVDDDELADLQSAGVKGTKKWDGSMSSDIDDMDDRNGKKQKRRFPYRLQPFKNNNGVKSGSIHTSAPPSPSRGYSSMEDDRKSIEYRTDRAIDDDHVARQANAQKEKSDRSKATRLGLPGLQTGEDTSRGRSPARHVVIESMDQKAKRLKQEEKDRTAALNKKDSPEDQLSDYSRSRDVSPVKAHDFALDHPTTPQTPTNPDYRKELLRVRTAMLSTGILARAISKPKSHSHSRLEACSIVVNRANGVTSHLSKSITENAQSITSVMKSFQSSTVSPIRHQIDEIRNQISESFEPAVQIASDTADELNAMVTSTCTLEIKRLADQGEIMIRKKGKGKRQLSRWGYLALEWVLLAIMWMVWFVWMVIRVFKVAIGGVVKGVRWILWI